MLYYISNNLYIFNYSHINTKTRINYLCMNAIGLRYVSNLVHRMRTKYPFPMRILVNKKQTDPMKMTNQGNEHI